MYIFYSAETRKQLKLGMEKLKKHAIKSGTLLIKENDVSRKLFILKKGKVRVFKSYLGGKITLATLSPGEIFGELSFFDSKPRSASVEALTDIVVHCVDGADLSAQIEDLPDWVHLIFDSVATRFRVVDQKMAVLQSLNDFQRKTLSNDSVGNTIYSDLLRMTKILLMIIHDKGNGVKKGDLIKDLSQTVGKTYVSSKAFVNTLLEFDFIDANQFEKNKLIYIYEESLQDFQNFLSREFENDSCAVLGHYSLAILRKALTYLEEGQDETSPDKVKLLPSEAINLGINEQDLQLAISQLKKIKAFQIERGGVLIEPELLVKLFRYHSIIKSFDHTMVYE